MIDNQLKNLECNEDNSALFSKHKLTDELVEDMIVKNIWNDNCPIHHSRLALLKLSYYDFSGAINNDGQMVVFDVVADKVLKIFESLFTNRFPINKIKLINEYNGNDFNSMEDNNTSSFNCRLIPGTDIVSIHSYGLAIDINPKQNPYVVFEQKTPGVMHVMPVSGIEYMNRLNIRDGMVESILPDGKTVIDIFKNNGFNIWGGTWNDSLDWHHFQLSRNDAELMAKMTFAEGSEYFENSFI